jgi:hypothetical protein
MLPILDISIDKIMNIYVQYLRDLYASDEDIPEAKLMKMVDNVDNKIDPTLFAFHTTSGPLPTIYGTVDDIATILDTSGRVDIDVYIQNIKRDKTSLIRAFSNMPGRAIYFYEKYK